MRTGRFQLDFDGSPVQPILQCLFPERLAHWSVVRGAGGADERVTQQRPQAAPRAAQCEPPSAAVGRHAVHQRRRAVDPLFYFLPREGELPQTEDSEDATPRYIKGFVTLSRLRDNLKREKVLRLTPAFPFQ